jgi:bifunctional non-homologous end joining protein LigD
MQPVLIDEPFDSHDCIFEVKWGGVRAIAELDTNRVAIHGRNLRDLTPLYPEVSALAGCLDATHALVDGEIVAWGAETLPSFDLLRPRLLRPEAPVAPRARSPVIYFVFDLLELDGESLLEQPLVERRNRLHERLKPHRVVQAGDFVLNDGVAFFDAVQAHGLEGIVAKEKHSVYRPGEQSSAWREVRAIRTGEFVIGGYTFGGGVRKDPISTLLLGAYEDGALHFVGQVSVGCSDREARQLLELLAPLHAGDAPFAEIPSVARLLYWCRPELACHIRFSEWTRDGMLRFPVFVAPRPDVPPEECERSSS